MLSAAGRQQSLYLVWFCLNVLGHLAGTPGSEPLHVQTPDGVWVDVWPVLGQVEGDIPFMAKLTNSVGHGATHACYHCAIEATWSKTASTNRCAPINRHRPPQDLEHVH